jgi:hypothetical protein
MEWERGKEILFIIERGAILSAMLLFDSRAIFAVAAGVCGLPAHGL